MNFLDFIFPIKPLVNLFTGLGDSVTKVNNGSWSVGDSFWNTMNTLTGGSFDSTGNFWKDISGQSTQEKINEQNLAFAREQLDYQKSIDAFNKDYTLNQNQYMVKDMANAGLNPIAISGSSGSHVSSSGASAPNLQAGPSTLSALLPLLSLGSEMFNSSKSRDLQRYGIDKQKSIADSNLQHQQEVLALERIKETNSKNFLDAQANLINAQADVQWQTAKHLKEYGTLPGQDTNIFKGAQNVVGVLKGAKEKIDNASSSSVEKMSQDITRDSFIETMRGDSSFGSFVDKRLNGRPMQSLTLSEMRSLYREYYGGKK